VYQVVSDADAFEGRSKTRRFENVAGDDLYPVMPRTPLKSRRISHNAPDAVTILQQPRNETPADVTRGPGNENQKATSTVIFMTLN
jgi:hypothetical protein